MMADFTTNVLVKGTAAELSAILNVFIEYEKGKKLYPEDSTKVYWYADVNGIRLSKLMSSSDGEDSAHAASEIIPSKAGDGKSDDQVMEMSLKADGPYGAFACLYEVPLFREMTDAAPGAYFQADISGETSYDSQYFQGILTGGILYERDVVFSDEEDGEDDSEDDSEDEGNNSGKADDPWCYGVYSPAQKEYIDTDEDLKLRFSIFEQKW